MLVQHKPSRVFASGGSHQQTQTRPGFFRVPFAQDRQGVGDAGAAPARARLRHLEIAPRCGLATFDENAAGLHMQTAPGLVLGQHAGDVVIHHHHLVAHAQPLTGKHANRRRAATHTHALLGDTIDHRRMTGLQTQLRAVFNLHFQSLLVAQLVHQFQGHAPLFFAAACQVMHAAQAQHLRAVFSRGDVANFFALVKHRSAFIADVTVGVYLHLEAAITEDALGDHGHHVHTARLRRDDEGRGFVIWVSGGCAYAGDEHAFFFIFKRGQSLRQGVCICSWVKAQRLVLCACLSVEKHHRV